MKAASSTGQTTITDFFSYEQFHHAVVQAESVIETHMRALQHVKQPVQVQPLLQMLFDNAVKNGMSDNGNRHNGVVKKFGAALYCLIGRSGYELIQQNLGSALPSLSTVQRLVSSRKIEEGHFYFKELKQHLRQWCASPYVHIHIDDTRIKDYLEYESFTDKFIGFCLLLTEGIPNPESFHFQTFEEIKTAYETVPRAKYAHCIVAKPVDILCPSFILCVMGTDSRYSNKEVISRWHHVSSKLKEVGITVVSNGADGAGPFLRAMVLESKLFTVSSQLSESWPFFFMPSFSPDNLCVQDHIHLLAKLRSRILKPSNLLIMGTEVACRNNIAEVLRTFPKERHNLTQRCLDNKDKQNYSSIPVLISDEVQECLSELSNTNRNTGTIVYLGMMRMIRDSIFDKSLAPIKRIELMWRAVFFCRIWRKWMSTQPYQEDLNFLTLNVYTCIEVNAHMILCLVINVFNGILPKECLRVWATGSQACEQTFRLLRSMTGNFSTIVNFTLKGILGRINKLNYVASIECTEEIVFPRTKKRLLQLNDETDDTLSIPDSMNQIRECILSAKQHAIEDAKVCKMELKDKKDYDDRRLIMHTVVDLLDGEDDDEEHGNDSNLSSDPNPALDNDSTAEDRDTAVLIQEDIAQVRLAKKQQKGLPTYTAVAAKGKGTEKGKSYKHSQFVEYKGAYIRKSTALYLLQENPELSSDRLIRVRANDGQSSSEPARTETTVTSGDLCIFRQIDTDDRILVGRMIQFTYLSGTKRQQEYSGMYVDLSEPSYKTIGVFGNWYAQEDNIKKQDLIEFVPIRHAFHIGYVSMENYVCTVPNANFISTDSGSFTIPRNMEIANLPNWQAMLAKRSDFGEGDF